MNNKIKKNLYIVIVICAIFIFASVASTFAYFQATAMSEENAVDVAAAEFKIRLEDSENTIIKNSIIPSIENYIDIATMQRRDELGNFKKANIDETTQEEIDKAGTACVDDNLNDICSIYTFSIYNDSKTDTPLYVTLKPSINTFENLYIKVIDNNNNVIIPKKHLIDDRYILDEHGNYQKDSEGNWIQKPNFDTLKPSPIVLSEINNLKGSVDLNDPTKLTYSIIMWVDENDRDQTHGDGGKLFASTLNIESKYEGIQGITGVFAAFGTE